MTSSFRHAFHGGCFLVAFALVVLRTSILPLGGTNGAAYAETITFFAAASTTDAVTEAVKRYKELHGGDVRTVFAASSTLATQIALGAPADLFLSANQHWMEYLSSKSVIEPDSSVTLLNNRLVLVAGASNPALTAGPPEVLGKSLPLDRILGDSRLAIGDPAHVPAGIYAKAALESLGLWSGYKDRLAFSGNVRNVLLLVQRGEAAAGIVYETDAGIVPELRVVGIFPADSHPPIVYPLAIVADRTSKDVEAFYRFLLDAEAREIFTHYGFTAAARKG